MSDIVERLAQFGETPHEGDPMVDILLDLTAEAKTEIERLQTIIDSRPSINAGLPDSYIEWSRGIYAMEIAHAQGKPS